MNGASAIERIAASHGQVAGRLAGGPDWAGRRRRALDALLARGLPERRDETWKYLDHARIGEYVFDVAPGAPPDEKTLAGARLPIAGALPIVLVDGQYDAALSAPAAAGWRASGLGALLAQDPAAAQATLRIPAEDADDRFALLAEAFADGGVVIRVDAGSVPSGPLHLLHVTTAANPAAQHARVVIEIGAGAQVVVVEEFLSLGGEAAFGNLAGELSIGASADVLHLRLHRENAASARIETWVARQAAGSRYRQHLVALGGRVLRSNLRLALEGGAAECRLAGLFLVSGERQVDLYTEVGHHAPRTRTVQDYRGIATDRGRGALNGRIVVHPAARGADASQSIRNLLLSPLAELNARPQLEIHVDDVRCRHGATTGTLDPAQLFYLQSRGLDEAVAKRLLTFAFCQDVLAGIPLAEFRDYAATQVAGILPDGELLRGPP